MPGQSARSDPLYRGLKGNESSGRRRIGRNLTQSSPCLDSAGRGKLPAGCDPDTLESERQTGPDIDHLVDRRVV